MTGMQTLVAATLLIVSLALIVVAHLLSRDDDRPRWRRMQSATLDRGPNRRRR